MKTLKNLYGAITPLLQKLSRDFPELSFILFGSRAEGRSQKYTDWDIGVYCKKGLPHATYLRLLRKKNDLVESFPYFVDLVNFNVAPRDFLKGLYPSWMLLMGPKENWQDLKKKTIS